MCNHWNHTGEFGLGMYYTLFLCLKPDSILSDAASNLLQKQLEYNTKMVKITELDEKDSSFLIEML